MQNIALAFSDGPKAVFAIFAAGVLPDHHRAFENSGTVVEADAPITQRFGVLGVIPLKLHYRKLRLTRSHCKGAQPAAWLAGRRATSRRPEAAVAIIRHSGQFLAWRRARALCAARRPALFAASRARRRHTASRERGSESARGIDSTQAGLWMERLRPGSPAQTTDGRQRPHNRTPKPADLRKTPRRPRRATACAAARWRAYRPRPPGRAWFQAGDASSPKPVLGTARIIRSPPPLSRSSAAVASASGWLLQLRRTRCSGEILRRAGPSETRMAAPSPTTARSPADLPFQR